MAKKKRRRSKLAGRTLVEYLKVLSRAEEDEGKWATIKHLENQFGVGKDAVKTALREGRELGLHPDFGEKHYTIPFGQMGCCYLEEGYNPKEHIKITNCGKSCVGTSTGVKRVGITLEDAFKRAKKIILVKHPELRQIQTPELEKKVKQIAHLFEGGGDGI